MPHHRGDGPAPFDIESVRRIRREYGAWAPVYDWFARATSSIGGVRDGCVAALDLDPGDTVVDFGCGPGVNFPALREAVGPEGRVVGVDVTRPMLERARGLAERRGWENVSLVQGDATNPPIESADAVLATFVTSLFPDPYAVCGWCELADSVVVANFAPHGGRVANAALGAFARLNARLFDFEAADPLRQLDARTAESRRALSDCLDSVDYRDYVFGTIRVHAGHRRSDAE
ncbi:class I SAM-dependent methyltransferase [Halobellus captivus]|uniref:class I SAM-dependent methyltransferase n=1 Tax=Halobellus captivus TaxID=2592614 RepID=UPI0011A3E2D0|nr:class I SAM-dependent methyltransferase [Halobellus captivus]